MAPINIINSKGKGKGKKPLTKKATTATGKLALNQLVKKKNGGRSSLTEAERDHRNDLRVQFIEKLRQINAGVSIESVTWRQIQKVLLKFGSSLKSASQNMIQDNFKRKLPKVTPSNVLARCMQRALDGLPSRC